MPSVPIGRLVGGLANQAVLQAVPHLVCFDTRDNICTQPVLMPQTNDVWAEHIARHFAGIASTKHADNAGAELQGRSYRGHLQYTTRMATTADFWAIAEVHAQSFYPTADWLFGPLLRLDRVCALQV